MLLDISCRHCSFVVISLQNQEHSCPWEENCQDNQVAFEEVRSQIHPFAERRYEPLITLLLEQRPVARNQMESSQLVEEKVGSIVESIG